MSKSGRWRGFTDANDHPDLKSCRHPRAGVRRVDVDICAGKRACLTGALRSHDLTEGRVLTGAEAR
jgi:hypothetical protein